jgi:hypothetical protein
MGKYDVDFDDYEEQSGGYDGPEPKRGVYPGKLVQFNEHTSGAGNEGLRWVFEITEGDYKGWRGYLYSNMDTAKWRTQEIVLAISGGKKEKVSLKPGSEGKRDEGADNVTVKKAKPVKLRVKNEQYEGETVGRLRNVLPSDGKSESSDEGGKKKKKKGDDPF